MLQELRVWDSPAAPGRARCRHPWVLGQAATHRGWCEPVAAPQGPQSPGGRLRDGPSTPTETEERGEVLQLPPETRLVPRGRGRSPNSRKENTKN